MDCARCGKSTNLAHIVTCQPSLRILRPKGLSLSANHIAHVFLVTADNQMVRIDTTRVVAGVANDRTGRYRAIVQFVTKTVSSYFVHALVALTADTHHAVSVMTLCSDPQPTILRRSLDDILPKAFCYWAAYSQAIMVALSETSFRCFDNSTASAGAANRARKRVSPCVVSAYVAPWFALNVTVECAVLRANLGFLSATTVTVTVGNFLRWVLSGMLAHVVSPSKAIGHATGRSLRRGGAFRLYTGVL